MSALNRWQLITLVLAVFCMFLAYCVIDQAITLGYRSTSNEQANKSIKLLERLLEKEWVGLQQAQVEAKLKAFVASQPPDSVLLMRKDNEGNVIYLEGSRFEFRDGKLFKAS